MNRNPAHREKNSLRTFFLFISVVLLLILGSLCVKVYQSVRSSTYVQSHAFIVSVATKDGVVYYNIVPKEKEIASLRLKTPDNHIDLPSDVSITSPMTSEQTRLKKLLPGLFIRGGKLTWFDITRLMAVTSPMMEQENNVESIPKGMTDDIDSGTLLNDPEIVEERLTVGIVNATGESGVGGRVEKILTALGATVVSVTTGRKDEDLSRITYTGQGSYTLERLQRLLKFPIESTDESSASDILILLGKDSLKKGMY